MTYVQTRQLFLRSRVLTFMTQFRPTALSGCMLGSLGRTLGSRPLAFALAVPLVCLLSHLAIARARADVGVVLNESLDEDFDRISSTGHSAIYFSRICPESPVKLRFCRPGEPRSEERRVGTEGRARGQG